MVILFKGTDKSKNYAPQALALCAGLSATKYFKKTLIIQLTTKYPVENYVIGKRINEQSINTDSYLFEDSGMDSLTRRAGVASFNEAHFTNAVKAVLSSENLFDILEVSKKVESDVEREIVSDPTVIGAVIKSAKKIYDNIFVLANGKAFDVVEAVMPYVDKTVTCVSQGIKEKISAKTPDDGFYLITGYDYKSTYSLRQMKKTYGNKKTFIMPYNVEFKDAYTNNNMLSFILHNTEPEKSDCGFNLINEMSKLTKVLTDDEDIEDDDFKFTYRTFERVIDKAVWLDGDNASIEVTKKKFLKREKIYPHVSVDKPISKVEIIDLESEKKGSKRELKKEAVKARKAKRKEAKSAKKEALNNKRQMRQVVSKRKEA